MRTKHILFSMALGAAFVGCSQEELVTVNDSAVKDAQLAIRPVVDTQITLNGDKTDTRLVLGSAFRPTWSTNDKVGAAIIDTPTYTDAADYATDLAAASGNPKALYTINEWYGCNNAFSTTDGGNTWAAEHPMVEGNYLFYAPYNKDMNVRTPLVVAVPVRQDASSAKSALTEFYTSGSVVEVGYKFITGSDKKEPANIKMFNIFAYPKFTITNNFDGYLFENTTATTPAVAAYNGAIKVDSIQLVNVNGSRAAITTMQIGGQLKHAQGAVTAIAATSGVVKELGGSWNDVDYLLADAETKDLLKTTYTPSTPKAYLVGRGNNPANNEMQGVITTLKVGQTIEQGQSIDVYCVMPAKKFDFTSDQLLAKLFVTINGKQYEICQATFAATGVDTWGVSDVKLNTAVSATDKGELFGAAGNAGLTTLSFMAGQCYPSEALRVDANGNYQKKNGVNNLLAINLTGGKAAKGTANAAQIAMLKGSVDTGITTTAGLIEAIENAANGTNWEEDATSSATVKGFDIAVNHSVEINSALINALARNNQNGGSFKLTETVLPVANDVTLTGATATSVTFTSSNGKQATIDLKSTLVSNAGYAIMGQTLTGTMGENTVVLVPAGKVWNPTADTEIKSLIIAPKSGSTAAGSVSVTTTKTLTARNISNQGTLAVGTVVAEEILNKEQINVSGEIKAPAGKTLSLTNNGTMETKATSAKFIVTAGNGKINLPENSASSSALVGSGATQEVIFVTTGAMATTQVGNAAAIPSVTSIKATGAITLTVDDVVNLGAINKIYASTAINTTATGTHTYDFTGKTLVLTANATWTGYNVNQTTIKGLTVNANSDYKLTLTNVSFTEATLTGAVYAGSGIVADGIVGKWNGAASAAVE